MDNFDEFGIALEDQDEMMLAAAAQAVAAIAVVEMEDMEEGKF